MTGVDLVEKGKRVFELNKGRFYPFIYLLCISIFVLSYKWDFGSRGKKMLLWIRDRGKGGGELCVQNYPPTPDKNFLQPLLNYF